MPLLKGSCLCNEVQYQLDAAEDLKLETSICHCRPCRKITGASTSINLTVPSSAFTLTSGSLKEITTKHVDAGFDFTLAFCGACGSPIYAAPVGSTAVIIQAGSLDDTGPLERIPTRELNINYRLPWVGKVEEAQQMRTYQP
ncbi:Mss4-like protein [Xylogone sp. PMI_703]|nr:Mss4-like protein [Xylogone sp. PMI_703]